MGTKMRGEKGEEEATWKKFCCENEQRNGVGATRMNNFIFIFLIKRHLKN